MEYILEIESLRKEFVGFKLNDVSFKLPYGSIMGLIGPNGSGKTTLIKLIMNLVRRTHGEITIFGKSNLKNEIEIKSRIGFVYDNLIAYDHLNINQMKSIIAPFYKKWNNDCFYNYIKIFELSLKQKIKTFSRGMRLKFALAIALSHDADLIIMDEPTSGLDPVFRRELLEILSNLISDKNKSILFSTHITSDLEQIADYVTFINKGDLVFSKTTNDILKNYGIISGDKELLNIQDKFDFCGYTKTQKGVEVLIDNFDEARIRLKNFKEISYKHANLEDIMYFINKKNKNNDYINN